MIVTNDAVHPVSLVILAGELTLADVDTMSVHYRKVHARQEPFFSFVDARFAGAPSGPVRDALGAMGGALDEGTRKWCVGAGVTLRNKLLVGVLRTVRWFVTPEIDVRPFSTCLAALNWGSGLLRSKQIGAPADLDSLVARLERASAADIAQFQSRA